MSYDSPSITDATFDQIQIDAKLPLQSFLMTKARRCVLLELALSGVGSLGVRTARHATVCIFQEMLCNVAMT